MTGQKFNILRMKKAFKNIFHNFKELSLNQIMQVFFEVYSLILTLSITVFLVVSFNFDRT